MGKQGGGKQATPLALALKTAADVKAAYTNATTSADGLASLIEQNAAWGWANNAFNHLHTNYDSSLVFLLGACMNSEEQKKVEEEDFYTKDIIQWDFHDSFQNLTVKECLFLQYSKRNLTVVTHIYKGDDDVFVNPIALGEVINNQPNKDDICMGSVLEGASKIQKSTMVQSWFHDGSVMVH